MHFNYKIIATSLSKFGIRERCILRCLEKRESSAPSPRVFKGCTTCRDGNVSPIRTHVYQLRQVQEAKIPPSGPDWEEAPGLAALGTHVVVWRVDLTAHCQDLFTEEDEEGHFALFSNLCLDLHDFYTAVQQKKTTLQAIDVEEWDVFYRTSYPCMRYQTRPRCTIMYFTRH